MTRSGVVPGRPRPSIRQIRPWTPEHFDGHGRWSVKTSGAIPGTAETWTWVDEALRRGFGAWWGEGRWRAPRRSPPRDANAGAGSHPAPPRLYAREAPDTYLLGRNPC